MARSLQHREAPFFPGDTDRLHPKRGKQKSTGGVEKWKANDAFHFPTPPTAARYLPRSLRYTNYPSGTKHRAVQAV